MAPATLETEDHSRDAAFNKAMHKDSSKATGGFSAMLKKDKAAQKAAVDEYFKHWDNKAAKDETDADREVCLPTSRVGMPQLTHMLELGTKRRICHSYETVRSQDCCIRDQF